MSVKICEIAITDTANMHSQATKIAILTAIKATDGPWEDAYLGLYTNETPFTPDSVLGDVDAPAWTGYATLPTEATNPVTPLGSYGATQEYISVDWQSHADADTTVRGVVVINSAGTGLLGFAAFDAPIPVAGVQSITVVLVHSWN